MANKAAVLFKCYYHNKSALKEFNRIKSSCDTELFDVFLSYDNTRRDLKKTPGTKYHVFDTEMIGNRYTEVYKVKNASLWKNTEHSTIDFCLKYPGYSHYWVVDHDVRFTGDWNSFFCSFMQSDADLIATYISRYGEGNWHNEVEESWWPWKSGNIIMDDSNKVRAFFATYRFSRRALELLDRKYISGIEGFCEMVVPTLLSHEGYSLQDIGKEYYDEKTFNFFNRVVKPGKEKNKLYHPVLPISKVAIRKIQGLKKQVEVAYKQSKLYKYASYYINKLS